MKIQKYNGKELYIGSIAENDEGIKHHMLAHFNLNETDTSEWYLRFNSQVKEMDNFIRLTKNKKELLDLGSQFGSFSFTFIGDSLDKKVFAFDGGINPYLTTSQIKYINNLTNFNVFNFLIGDMDGIIKCFSESLQSLAIPGDDTKVMLTVDTIVDMFNITPDVIKIDIEGCEYKALSAAKNSINKFKPIIFIEVHPKFLIQYNNSIEDIVTFVESINYDVYDLDNKKVENYLEILQKEMTDSNRTIWMPKK
jgi:FkbM family methyltransferase